MGQAGSSFAFPIRSKVNIENPLIRMVSHRDMLHFGDVLVRRIEENGSITFPVDDQLIEEWLKWDRISRVTDRPTSLFICDEVFFSSHGNLIKNNNVNNISGLVKRLPFRLICNENQIEAAHAVDLNGDGLAQVWLVRYPAREKGEASDFDLINVMKDGSTDIDPEFRERIEE